MLKLKLSHITELTMCEANHTMIAVINTPTLPYNTPLCVVCTIYYFKCVLDQS